MSRPLPCGSGDTRRAAQRPPVQPQCWFFPLARACPTVMPEQSPHHEDAFGAPCVVRIDVHGSKDRAKDASAERKRRSLVRASGAYALCACATTFPSSASSGHPLSSARLPSREDTRYGPTDRPRPSFRRRPAKGAAFQKTRMPSTATTREGDIAEGLLPPALTPALSLTPPTPIPCGKVLLMGIARSRCGHPRVREQREYRRLFNAVDSSRLGLTTQARHRARPTRPSTRTDCPARIDASRSA